ncbi:hypothetical protein DSC91_000840 [Paraburkholderia caffeinilytica]|nr:hypothetical protein DSC91_000840 [Paraburkholderia caffeinilytica]
MGACVCFEASRSHGMRAGMPDLIGQRKSATRGLTGAQQQQNARADQRGQRQIGQVIASLQMRCESS